MPTILLPEPLPHQLDVLQHKAWYYLTPQAWDARPDRAYTQYMLGLALWKSGELDEALQAVTKDYLVGQKGGKPVHEWKPVGMPARGERRAAYEKVGQIMSRDLITVQAEDTVTLAEAMMRWEGIRHIPVENEEGELVGMFSLNDVVQALRTSKSQEEGMRIGEIMHDSPRTVSADMPTVDAIRIMRDENISALPVVRDGKLEGILTDSDFLVVAARLLE